jgi:hypothetical protein
MIASFYLIVSFLEISLMVVVMLVVSMLLRLLPDSLSVIMAVPLLLWSL